MNRRHSIFLLTFFILALAAACGSDSTPNSPEVEGAASTGSPDAIEIPSSIVQQNATFNPDSFVSAGWKKSKQYSTETVPDANEIWYGFFNQKDIEIRFYDDHETALNLGKPVAEAAIAENVKRSRGGELLDVSGGSFSAYNAYVVAGNAILLCELDISACEALVENLE